MKILSHRGNGNKNYKENTFIAIKNSLNKKYIDGVEFDIRSTLDNHFVLSHSPIVKNIGLINKMNIKLLKKHGLEELNDVLKKIKTNKILLIDIKLEIGDYIKIAKILNKVLKKYSKLNIYLCSFNYKLVKYLKSNYKYKVGLIISNIINRKKDYNIFDFLVINYKINIKYNKTIMLWTINKKEEINKYKNHDFYIITDKPYLINK